MARPSKDDKKKPIVWQGEKDKRKVLFLLRALIQKQHTDDYEKSMRKDELYIINSEKFQQAISIARKNLGLVKGKRKGVLTADFERAKKEVLQHVGLPSEWDEYVGRYIATNSPPGEDVFFKQTKIWVEDITEKNELIVRLQPGLRYEEYRKAWSVLVRTLGEGARLNKPYTNEELHLKMLEDKNNGLTYRQIAEKYYQGDVLVNTDRVKKAVSRLKKRIQGDK